MNSLCIIISKLLKIINLEKLQNFDPNNFFHKLYSFLIKLLNYIPKTIKIEQNIEGILKVLTILISRNDYLKNKKQNLELINTIFNDFLFSLKKEESCNSANCRKSSFNFLIELSKNCFQNNQYLINLIAPLQTNLNVPESWRYWPNYEIRLPNIKYLGLRNGGSTCYLNSLLQQFFMVPKFRNSLLFSRIGNYADHQINQDQKIELDPNENVLKHFQLIFANLLKSDKAFASTKDFCKKYLDWEGNPINPLVQMDAFEFFNTLFSKLESNLYLKNLIIDLFGGKLCNQISAVDTPHSSERLENFYTISLDVIRKNDIYNSLDQYIEGELLQGDNKYYLEELDQKVDAIKRVFIDTLPKNLIIHLKRFEYDLTTMKRYKVNDYFEFPTKLNMYKYTREGISKEEKSQNNNESNDKHGIHKKEIEKASNSCYDYRLVGILVHRGSTQFGHYYSYIKERNSSKWIEFNDEIIKDFNINSIPEKCFGERKKKLDTSKKLKNKKYTVHNNLPRIKNYSAYMLFYQKLDTIHENNSNNNEKLQNNLLKLPVIQKVLNENILFLRRKQIFNEEYFYFVEQICKNTKDSAIIKLAFQFFIKIYLHSRKKPRLNSWIEYIENIFTNSYEISKWFVERILQNFYLNKKKNENKKIKMQIGSNINHNNNNNSSSSSNNHIDLEIQKEINFDKKNETIKETNVGKENKIILAKGMKSEMNNEMEMETEKHIEMKTERQMEMEMEIENAKENENENENENDKEIKKKNSEENNKLNVLNKIDNEELNKIFYITFNKSFFQKQKTLISTLFVSSFKKVFSKEKKDFIQDLKLVKQHMNEQILELFVKQNHTIISNILHTKLQNIPTDQFKTMSCKFLYMILFYIDQPLEEWRKFKELFLLLINLIKLDPLIYQFFIDSRGITLLMDQVLDNYSPFREKQLETFSVKKFKNNLKSITFFPLFLDQLLNLSYSNNSNDKNNNNNNDDDDDLNMEGNEKNDKDNDIDNNEDNEDSNNNEDNGLTIHNIDLFLLKMPLFYKKLLKLDINDSSSISIISTLCLKRNLKEDFLPLYMKCIDFCDSQQLKLLFSSLQKIINTYTELNDEIFRQIIEKILNNFKYLKVSKVSIASLRELSNTNELARKWLLNNHDSWLFEFLINSKYFKIRNMSKKLFNLLIYLQANQTDNDQDLQVFEFYFENLLNLIPQITSEILYPDLKPKEKIKSKKEKNLPNHFKLTSYLELLIKIIKQNTNVLKLLCLDDSTVFLNFWDLLLTVSNYSIPQDFNKLSIFQFLNFILQSNDNLIYLLNLFEQKKIDFSHLINIHLGFGSVKQEFNDKFLLEYFHLLYLIALNNNKYKAIILNSKNYNDSLKHILNNKKNSFKESRKRLQLLFNLINN
ncbi:ubiquitin carboxyl-terminal hydrolase faf-y-related [Anaeramoeba flamelloides]|uniref:Ubiquitin carboxyl-terminal hydrolase faf-y-related n=1 Tax=Anaeramoeba flamelloides TaxID=1746091 RepID=A0AAV7Z4L3_9EUKA|nr:ubiquitin carboxyl-terminal hydrolase faf-y-related [Anaeramoeba flamelloides]